MAQEAHSSPPVLPSRPFRGRQTDPPELPLPLPALHQNAKCSTACPDIYRAAPGGAREGCRHETLIRVIIKYLINITAAAYYRSDSSEGNRRHQHPRAAAPAPELGQGGTEPGPRRGEAQAPSHAPHCPASQSHLHRGDELDGADEGQGGARCEVEANGLEEMGCVNLYIHKHVKHLQSLRGIDGNW